MPCPSFRGDVVTQGDRGKRVPWSPRCGGWRHPPGLALDDGSLAGGLMVSLVAILSRPVPKPSICMWLDINKLPRMESWALS